VRYEDFYVTTFSSDIVEKYLVCLVSNAVTMLAENLTVEPNILPQINSVPSRIANFGVILVVVPQAQRYR